jgi:hypothetical protein
MKVSIPYIFSKVESIVIAIFSIFLYIQEDGTVFLYFILWLIPDIGMLGYLINKKIGAITYNLFHFYPIPVFLILLSQVSTTLNLVLIAIIWISHIAIDRALGYGLKYGTGFKNTTEQALMKEFDGTNMETS